MNFSKVKLQLIRDKNFSYNSRQIKSSQDIVDYINSIEQLEKAAQESAIIICLNSKNQIILYTEVGKGGINYCQIDISLILKVALLCNSQKIILTHNHPSGNPSPSQEDLELTKKIKNIAELMGIQLLDHIIVR